MISQQPHIIVVGAGIVGASIAYHLACRQARVTLIDTTTEPAGEATEKSFAWITVNHDAPEAYINFRQNAIADWHRVEKELNGQVKIDWQGALRWCESTADTERIVNKLSYSGYPVRFIDKQEIQRLEPHLKEIPNGAMFAKQEGALDPAETTKLLLKAARQRGASIQPGNEVLSFITNGKHVVGIKTAHGTIMADVVVIAAGAYTNDLCQPLGFELPIQTTPAILMRFHTIHRFVNRVISNPFMEVRAVSNTLMLAVEDYIDESTNNNPQAVAQRTLEKIKTHWYQAEETTLRDAVVRRRPIPKDGLPLIGWITDIDGLYVSVMHAGVTLAAIAGRLAAAEILSGEDDPLLSSYRPVTSQYTLQATMPPE